MENLAGRIPQYKGIDLYKNEGYGCNKSYFEYLPNSGKATILHVKNDIDWVNKSRADYYVSGIRLLLKKKSGDVYDTGLVIFQKDEIWAKGISLPKENICKFQGQRDRNFTRKLMRHKKSFIYLPKSTTS